MSEDEAIERLKGDFKKYGSNTELSKRELVCFKYGFCLGKTDGQFETFELIREELKNLEQG